MAERSRLRMERIRSQSARVIRCIVAVFNYNERRRSLDLEILWPICKEQAQNMDHAKAAFAYHCYNDPAWKALGDDEIYRRIDALK